MRVRCTQPGSSTEAQDCQAHGAQVQVYPVQLRHQPPGQSYQARQSQVSWVGNVENAQKYYQNKIEEWIFVCEASLKPLLQIAFYE